MAFVDKHHFDITIIGAGVVGLAVAEELSGRFKNVLLLEKNESHGQETSSRNSEVIHAGIYYPTGSLKASLCVEGRKLLYETCEKRDIPFRRTGKLIVATRPEEEEALAVLMGKAHLNGVDDLLLLSGRVVHSLEPEVSAAAGLLSPSTGIIDSHRLMRALLAGATENEATAVFRSCVTAARFDGVRHDLEVNGGEYRVSSRVVVNSSGLHSDRVAALAGIDVDREGYRLKLCKGNYFSASPPPRLRHLVYPVPTPKHEGLGVHATIDLGGRVRFGPDVEYVDGIDYRVDEGKRDIFHESILTYLPLLAKESLSPDMCGIRPKLQGPGEDVRDFVISEESRLGLRGWINLVGIESPGLTACMAIAKQVSNLVRQVMG
jgi:L-2-hydroxyglutarate oxidase LhgO